MNIANKHPKQAKTHLKECPFCGSQAVTLLTLTNYYVATCPKCGAQSNCWSQREEAIKAWNKRK